MKPTNTLSDALHVMAHLVGQTAPRTSAQLATCLPTHPVVIRRLLAQLQRAGLVRSERGHGGGSVLARPPAQITLLDIYRGIDSPPLIQIGAREGAVGCPIKQLVDTALHDGALEAQRLLEARLGASTLASLGAAFADHLQLHTSHGVPHAN